LTYDRLWKRYVAVFDEVRILARAQRVSEIPKDMGMATGPGVSFCALPDYQGPWQYLGVHRRVKQVVREAVDECDAFLLRVPGNVATVVWKELRLRGLPFGVEVVGDPWTGFAPGAFRTSLRPVFRRLYTRNLALQCREAIAVSYITDHVLQDLYPPGGWSIGVSGVYLDDEDFADAGRMEERIQSYGVPRSRERPWRLVHIGSLSQPYKGHEILLRSVATCVRGGLPIHLTLLGEGAYQSQYEALAQTLGIGDRVGFLGTLPAGAPVHRVLDASDLFVFPSLTEGQGRVLIEAMARGLPCVASQVGGIVELLEPRDMVPPRDVAALAGKIQEVLGDPERLASMARRNRKEAEQYHNRVLKPRREEFYRQVRDRTLAWRSGNKK
jgi:glycosyltransferase involved in cell wall biosynthesis